LKGEAALRRRKSGSSASGKRSVRARGAVRTGFPFSARTSAEKNGVRGKVRKKLSVGGAIIEERLRKGGARH